MNKLIGGFSMDRRTNGVKCNSGVGIVEWSLLGEWVTKKNR
jgi:hypothetical protein